MKWAWIIALGFVACSKSNPSASGGSAGSAGSAVGSATAGSAAGSAPGSATDSEPVEHEYGEGAIATVCERADACKCSVPDCAKFFADIGMPDTVYACLASQTCEMLCAPKAGAPGTPLHDACIKGADPEPAGGGMVTKSCRATSECPGKHECCGGYCYELGTSLWITACQMPTGKF